MTTTEQTPTKAYQFYASQDFKARPSNGLPPFKARITLEEGDTREVSLFVNRTKEGKVSLTSTLRSETQGGDTLDRLAAMAGGQEIEIAELGLKIRPGQVLMFQNDKGDNAARKDFRGYFLAGDTADQLYALDVWLHERAPKKDGVPGALYLSGPVKKIDLDQARARLKERQKGRSMA